MKSIKYLIILLSLIVVGNTSVAQNQQDTLRVLFAGNSYIYFSNMPHLVSLISDSTNTKLITSKSVAGGVSLSDHWKGEKGLKTMNLIKTGDFDIVVLQEQSMGTIEQADSFMIYSQKLCALIKENGAQPFFFMTWAREKVPQFQKTITEVYTKAANENNAGLAQAGNAWALAQELRPGIELYTPDGSHPSDLGAFLTACVFVEALTNELPASLQSRYTVKDANGEELILISLHPLDIIFCLKVVEQIRL